MAVLASSSQQLVVLLSSGRNPVSGRERCARRDARSITLARSTGLPVIGVHVGQPSAALQAYLGLGLADLVLIPSAAGEDPVPALCAWLKEQTFALVFAGSQAETGDGSGLVPYLIAKALGIPLLPNIVDATVVPPGWRITQALPGGRRRQLGIKTAAVLTVDGSTESIDQIAKAIALRAKVSIVQTYDDTRGDSLVPLIDRECPAKRLPRRISPVTMGSVSAGQQLHERPTPRQAASQILRFLIEQQLITASDKLKMSLTEADDGSL